MVTLGPQTRPAEAPAGAELSFEAYVAARGPALVRFAMLLTGDDHRGEDLVQDALTKAYLRLDDIETRVPLALRSRTSSGAGYDVPELARRMLVS